MSHSDSYTYLLTEEMATRISLLGNCQTVGYCWFLNKLGESTGEVQAKWLNFDMWDVAWPKNSKVFGKQLQNNVYALNDCKATLETSDAVVYQPHFGSLAALKTVRNQKNLKRLSISPVILGEYDFMLRKEKKYNTTISILDFIQSHQEDEISVDRKQHMKTFFSLEIVRRICWVLGLKYFSSEEYQDLMATQYPYF